MNERIGVFVDVSNIYYCVAQKYNAKVNYYKYLNIAVNGDMNKLYRAIAYGAQISNQASKFLECLHSFGYEPKYKEPKQFDNPDYEIDLAPVELIINQVINDGSTNISEEKIQLYSRVTETMNLLRNTLKRKRSTRKADWDVGIAIDIVRLIQRVDTIILGSADSDLAPVVEYVREQGCRCVIYACNISKELREVANATIEIDENILELN